jgi:hypothetical protein
MIFSVINNVNDMGSHRVRTFNVPNFVLVLPDDSPLLPKHFAKILISL